MAIQKTILFTAQSAPSLTPAPVPATDAILTFSADIQFETDTLERKRDKSFFGADAKTIVGRRAKISFDFELMGALTPGLAAPIGRVFECCAMAETLVPVGPPIEARYRVVTTGQKNALIYFYWGDGSSSDLLFVVSAARGDITTSVKSAEYWKGKATFTGTVALPTEAGPPTGVVLTGFQNPAPATTELAELVVNGVPLRCYQFDCNLGNDVQQIEDFKQRDSKIVQRASGGTIYVVKEDFSVINWYALADSQATNNTLLCSVSDGPGRIALCDVPNAQFEFPKLSNYKEQPAYEIPYLALPSSSGNDEVTFKFR